MFESQRKVQYENPASMVYDRKLDTALRMSTCEAWVNRLREGVFEENKPNDGTLFYRMVKRETNKTDNELVAMVNRNIWPQILKDTLTFEQPKKVPDNVKTNAISPVLMRALRLQLITIFESTEHPEIVPLYDEINNWMQEKKTFPAEVQRALLASHVISKTVELKASYLNDDLVKELKYRRTPEAGASGFFLNGKRCETVWTKTYIYIRYDMLETIVPYPYLLLIHNKLSDLVSVLVYSHYVDGNTLEQGSYRDTVDFVKSLAFMGIKHPIKCYDIMRLIEGINVGLTLQQIEGQSNAKFLQVLLDDAHQIINEEIEGHEWYHIMCQSSIPFRHELACLSKILGHPFVDMEQGSEKLRLNTTQENEVCVDLVVESVNAAKKSFIKTYIYKHKKWPPIKDGTLQNPRLRRACNLNVDPDSAEFIRQYGSVSSISDYKEVELLPCERFVKLENFIPYLKDKTITVLRSEVFRRYLCDNVKQERIPARQQWKKTRLLLYYLLTGEEQTQHIESLNWWLDQQEDFGEVLKYLVMRVVPKEKELKRLYRGFGCKTFMWRTTTLVAQKNASNFLDKYSTEQAMTLTELEILRKLDSFRRIQMAHRNVSPLYLTLDVSAWNNSFRKEAVDPVLRETLDKVYGVHMFEKTQEAYESTLIFIPDEVRTYWWNGQKGGIEGQNQYEWDLVYLAQIHVAMQDVGLEYYVFCKGDDVRIVLLVPHEQLKTQTIDHFRDTILTQLKNTLSKYGHKINKAESYASLSYFAFSKSASYKFIELPQAYRKIQKCYGANNALLPFIDDYVASSFSNAHSACKASINFVAPYCVACFWAIYHLNTHPSYKNCSEVELTALMLVPGLLGGFPVIYLHNMMIRSESDLLSPFLHILFRAKEIDPDVFEKMKCFLKVNLDDSGNSLVGLMLDPYSLPLKKPVSPSTVFRKLILPALKRVVKNESVVECIEAVDSGCMEPFMDAFQSANVYNSRIMSAIYDCTPHGFLESLLRKFETGRSVVNLLLSSFSFRATNRYLQTTIKADRKLQRYRNNLLAGTVEYDKDMYQMIEDVECPVEAAQRLRDVLWGKKIESVTMPPLQHQVKIMSLFSARIDPYSRINHFEAEYSSATQLLPGRKVPAFSAGDKKPFIGHRTKSGMRQGRTAQFVEKNEILNKVKTLLDLISWCRMTDGNINPALAIIGNTDLVIRKILPSYISLDLDKIYAFRAERKSGTIMHHVRSPGYREAVVPNILSNPYTRYRCDTNTNQTVRNSCDHFTINFLHVLCYGVSVISLKYAFSSQDYRGPFSLALVITSCPSCNRKIMETPMRLDEGKVSRINFPRLSVMRVGQEAQRIIDDSLGTIKKFQQRALPISELSPHYACRAMAQLLTQSTYTNRSSLQNFAFRHHMSSEAEAIVAGIVGAPDRKAVSLNELKPVGPKEFLMAMYPLVIWFCYSQLDAHDINGLAIQLRSINAEELPWYPAIIVIKELGKMAHLITQASNESNVAYANIEQSPGATAKYIALACMAINLQDESANQSVVIMSYYTAEYIMPYIEKVYNARLRNRLYHCYVATLLSLTPHAGNYQFRFDTLCYLYVAICIYEFDEQAQEMVATYIDSCGSNDEYFVGNEANSLFDTNHHLAETAQEVHYLLHHFLSLPGMCTDIAFEDIRNYLSQNVWVIDSLAEDIREKVKVVSVQLVYTDYESCVSRVRSLPVQPIHIPMRVDRADPDVSFNINPSVPHEQSERILSFGYAEPSQIYHGSNDNWADYVEYQKTHFVIDHRWLSRPFFRSTTALCKLNEIFEVFSIYPLPDGGTYYTLGDGFGGFCALINRNTEGSDLYFNTLAEGNNDAMPYAVMGEPPRNTIIYEDMKQGLSDLTSTALIDSIIANDVDGALIVTCDAQTLGMNMEDRWTLLRNVGIIYLSKRDPYGILIVKLYLNESRINSKFIANLRVYVTHTVMYKPTPSGDNDEVYLIAWGEKKTFDKNAMHADIYNTAHADERILRYTNILRENLNNSRAIMNVIRYVDKPKPDMHKRIASFNLTCITNFRDKLGLILPGNFDTMARAQKWNECDTIIYNGLVDAKNRYIKYLNGIRPGQRSWDTNTKATAVKAYLNAVSVLGAIKIMEIYKRKHPDLEFEVDEIFRAYLDALDEIAFRRLYEPAVDFELETRTVKGIEFYGYQGTPWERFTQGVCVCFSYLGLRRVFSDLQVRSRRSLRPIYDAAIEDMADTDSEYSSDDDE